MLLQGNRQLEFHIKLHALLLWSSIGVLMPVGIIIVRMSRRVPGIKMLKALFYAHVIVQVCRQVWNLPSFQTKLDCNEITSNWMNRTVHGNLAGYCCSSSSSDELRELLKQHSPEDRICVVCPHLASSISCLLQASKVILYLYLSTSISKNNNKNKNKKKSYLMLLISSQRHEDKEHLVSFALAAWNWSLRAGNGKHLYWLKCIPWEDVKKCEPVEGPVHCTSLHHCHCLFVPR